MCAPLHCLREGVISFRPNIVFLSQITIQSVQEVGIIFVMKRMRILFRIAFEQRQILLQSNNRIAFVVNCKQIVTHLGDSSHITM